MRVKRASDSKDMVVIGTGKFYAGSKHHTLAKSREKSLIYSSINVSVVIMTKAENCKKPLKCSPMIQRRP